MGKKADAGQSDKDQTQAQQKKDEVAGRDDLTASGFVQSLTADGIENSDQAKILNNAQLPASYRRQVASHLGRLKGNRYMAGVMRQVSQTRGTSRRYAPGVQRELAANYQSQIKEPLETGVTDWAVTDSEVRQVLGTLAGLSDEDLRDTVRQMRRDHILNTLYENIMETDEIVTGYQSVIRRIQQAEGAQSRSAQQALNWALVQSLQDVTGNYVSTLRSETRSAVSEDLQRDLTHLTGVDLPQLRTNLANLKALENFSSAADFVRNATALQTATDSFSRALAANQRAGGSPQSITEAGESFRQAILALAEEADSVPGVPPVIKLYVKSLLMTAGNFASAATQIFASYVQRINRATQYHTAVTRGVHGRELRNELVDLMDALGTDFLPMNDSGSRDQAQQVLGRKIHDLMEKVYDLLDEDAMEDYIENNTYFSAQVEGDQDARETWVLARMREMADRLHQEKSQATRVASAENTVKTNRLLTLVTRTDLIIGRGFPHLYGFATMFQPRVSIDRRLGHLLHRGQQPRVATIEHFNFRL